MPVRGRASSSAPGHRSRSRGDRGPQAYDGVARGQLSDIQRTRILAAMLDVAVERGAGDVSVAHVVDRAGVSRRTFYEIFTDREDCFLAAFEQALVRATGRVLPAYEAERAWREKVRAGLAALLSFIDEEPVIGQVLIVESLAGGPKALARRHEAMGKLAVAIEGGRDEAKASFSPAPLTGEGLVGGALAVIGSRLTEQNGESLVQLTNSLMSMIVLPYLGVSAARRELERPLPTATEPKNAGAPAFSDPLKDAGLRLSYRTVRVLVAIADNPGASNRLIGDTAEVKDQGQISKLLTRLERAGMIVNTGVTPGKGAPNSWGLTPSGQQVVSTMKAHAEDRKRGRDER